MSHAPHSAGGHSTVESGSSTSRIVTPGAPNGLPRLPPEDPEDRFDLANPSCDGGFELLDESVPRRRFNSASSTSSSAILAACAATSCASSSYDGRCGSALDTPEPCHANRSPSIKTRRRLKLNTYKRAGAEVVAKPWHRVQSHMRRKWRSPRGVFRLSSTPQVSHSTKRSRCARGSPSRVRRHSQHSIELHRTRANAAVSVGPIAASARDAAVDGKQPDKHGAGGNGNRPSPSIRSGDDTAKQAEQ